MPKVSQEYYNEKKDFIIAHLRELARSRPIFAITMQELIISTGMSQGAIYRYFKDIDEVISVLYLKLSEQEKCVEVKFGSIFNDKRTPEEIIYSAFENIAEFYLEEGSVFNEVNKMIWELNILYLYDKKRVEKIVGKTDQNNISVQVRKYLTEYISSQISNGYFKPVMPIDRGIALISNSIDGTIRNYYMSSYYPRTTKNTLVNEMKDIRSMLEGIAVMMIQMLGGDCSLIQDDM